MVCYWHTAGLRPCGYRTRDHKALKQHFNKVHLANNGQQAEPYPCLWPGSPAFTTHNGTDIADTQLCTKTYKSKGSADRHARLHQHQIWTQVEGFTAAQLAGG